MRGVLQAIALTLSITPTWAAEQRFVMPAIATIEITEASGRTLIERKELHDCSTFVLRENDVRYALRHSRRVSRQTFDEQLVSIGCYGSAQLAFRDGSGALAVIEPTGRMTLSFERGARSGRTYYFGCSACQDRAFAWR